MIKDDKQYLQNLKLYRQFKNFPQSEERDESIKFLDRGLSEYEELRGDKDRVGTYMFSVTGIRIWPQDPRPEEIDPRDMAYGLSRINRFNGMSSGPPYSVGLHCVYGSYLIDPKYALHFLLHDGQEYICHDIMTQIKRVIGNEYKDLEHGLELAIAKRFEIEWTDDARKAVKEMDEKMLATEVENLTYNRLIRTEINQIPYTLDEVKILQFNWDDVFILYLYRLYELSNSEMYLTQYEYYKAKAIECQIKQSIHPDIIQAN